MQQQILISLFFFFADFYQPFKEDELEQSTEVQIMFPSEPPVSFLACNDCFEVAGLHEMIW